MGVVECHRRFGDEIVISCPVESEPIPLAQLISIPVSATSDHEYFGPMIPRVLAHLQGYNGGPLRQPTQRIHHGQRCTPCARA